MASVTWQVEWKFRISEPCYPHYNMKAALVSANPRKCMACLGRGSAVWLTPRGPRRKYRADGKAYLP
jgi:hypothetical protein